MSQWINFKELRSKLDFHAVLKLYGIETDDGSEQHTGPCPLPKHPKGKTGNTFSAQLEKGIWQCFSCKAKGNLIEFAALMDGLDPEKPDEFRKTALKLQQQFFAKASRPENPKTTKPKPAAKADRTVVNAPLDFELKRLEPDHSSLRELQLEPETIDSFGLGYCSHGYFKDRIAIPLHRDGQLVGYAGLGRDGYLFPKPREHDGITHIFNPSLLLYEAEREQPTVETLYLVQSCLDVWWLWQHGFQDVVGLMGDSVSPAQVELLKSLVVPSGRILVLTEREEAAWSLVPHRFVRWVKPIKSLHFLKTTALKALLE